MRKILLLMAVAVVAFAASAVPAVPHPVENIQPDGSKLMVRILGDEYFNYHTTTDGYTIVQDERGYYVYAVKQNDVMTPTAMVAHNVGERSAAEVAFLAGVEKYQYSKSTARNAKARRAVGDKATKAAQYDYNKFKGLIILVDYSDIKFTRGDAQDFYSKMVNTRGYTGFVNEDGTANRYGDFTGSVRDYYYDNSQGRFDPTFDVYGPVHLTNYTANSHNRTSNSAAIWKAALQQLDSQVDFSQYDTDGDGIVDMVYFIGAGSGSNSDSSNPQHLWPHKWDLYYQNVTLDGVRFRTYACSTEYLYNQSNGVFDGIGTICHEFSHVLGLPDLYDTDYETNGQSNHPGNWDIMAGGSYGNNARTPVAYSLYDRYSIGFANASVIRQKGDYTLNQIGTTGEGYILPSGENNVKFYIENRQQTRWDAYAPGHGMIVARVDSTSTSVWTGNSVNDNAERNYYMLLRAGNGTSTAQASDAFPGTTGSSILSNGTTPSLLTYDNVPCPYAITNIKEEGGVISFTIGGDESLMSVVEDFEEMPVTTNTAETNVKGVYSTWTFANARVTNPGSDLCNGEHSVVMKRPAAITMTKDVRYKSYKVSFDVYNSSNAAYAVSLYTSTDQGANWSARTATTGSTSVSVPANTTTNVSFNFDVDVPIRYRVNITNGSTSYLAYLDDFTIYYTDVIPEEATPLSTVLSEGEENEEYLIADELAVVEVADNPKYLFLTDGQGNWIRAAAGDYYNAAKGMGTIAAESLRGVFTGKDFIPTITLTEAPQEGTGAVSVTPDDYNLANDFAPKVNEVLYVTGYYNENDKALRGYAPSPGGQGQSATLDLSWLAQSWTPEDAKRYRVLGVAQIKEPWKTPAPALKDYDYDFQNYLIFPLSLPVATGVQNLAADTDNAPVNVYNMQGQLLKAGVQPGEAQHGLLPGIYLIGGKKVVVK